MWGTSTSKAHAGWWGREQEEGSVVYGTGRRGCGAGWIEEPENDSKEMEPVAGVPYTPHRV